MFWSKKADPFERERLLYLTQISDLRSELSETRLAAAAEREKLLERIIAIGYPRLAASTQTRSTKPATSTPLYPGYRPDLRPADPPAEATEAIEAAQTPESALASLLVPPTFANNSDNRN